MASGLVEPVGIATRQLRAQRRWSQERKAPTVGLFGSQCISCCGILLIASNEVPVADGTGLTGEQGPGLSVRLICTSNHAIASYVLWL